MSAHFYSTFTRCLLLSVALVLLPAFVFAQESALLADPAEIAVEHLPTAPVYIAEAAGELPLPANSALMTPVAFAPVTEPREQPVPHRFWDGENRILFATVSAFAAADFCATRANLASGGQELNPVTRVLSGSTPGLAANFALETSGVMAISYMFHRTGHHKLERIASLVSISTSATAVGYDLAHRQR